MIVSSSYTTRNRSTKNLKRGQETGPALPLEDVMTEQERSEMFDRALKLNAVDRAELSVRKFLKTPYAPPVVVLVGFGALGAVQGFIEKMF